MSTKRAQQVAIVIGILISLSSANVLAAPKRPESLVATANGKGTLKAGREVFQVNSVVVKLSEDGTAEITLVSDITFFMSGKWKADSTNPNLINLVITGSMTGGGVQGTGTLLLRGDKKTIDRFSAAGGLKTSTRKISIKFVAE